MSGLEPPTSSLPRMRATDCATSAVLVYNSKFEEICQSFFEKNNKNFLYGGHDIMRSLWTETGRCGKIRLRI